MPAHAQLQKYSNKREGLVCWLHFISLAKDTRQPLVPSKDFEIVFFREENFHIWKLCSLWVSAQVYHELRPN